MAPATMAEPRGMRKQRTTSLSRASHIQYPTSVWNGLSSVPRQAAMR